MTRYFATSLFSLLIVSCAPGAGNRENAGESDMPATSNAKPPQIAADDTDTSNGNLGRGQDADDDSDACGTAKVEAYIGKEATVPVRSAVARASGAGSDRWIYPDSVVTEDFSPTRLNVVMDKATNKIVSMHCG